VYQDVYEGCKIYAHVGKINDQKINDFKTEIKYWDPKDEWSFENDDRTIIHHETSDSIIKVTFNGEPTDLEVSMGLSKYGVVFESYVFGWKNDYHHQEICQEIYKKIRWQKRIFLLTNKGMKPFKNRSKR
jgi:hypothetical protein